MRDTVLRFAVDGGGSGGSIRGSGSSSRSSDRGGRGGLMPYHVLGQGDVVLLSRGGQPGEDSNEGVVLDYCSRWVRVVMPADIARHVEVSCFCQATNQLKV